LGLAAIDPRLSKRENRLPDRLIPPSARKSTELLLTIGLCRLGGLGRAILELQLELR
jgi:hypothetical protein